MNMLLSDRPVSTAEVSSSDAIVPTPPRSMPTDADTSHGGLIFTKFLEDQGFVELLLERSLLDGSAKRLVARAPTEPVATPSATILRRICTTLASAITARCTSSARRVFWSRPSFGRLTFW